MVPAGPAPADWFQVFPQVLIGADGDHFGAPGDRAGEYGFDLRTGCGGSGGQRSAQVGAAAPAAGVEVPSVERVVRAAPEQVDGAGLDRRGGRVAVGLAAEGRPAAPRSAAIAAVFPVDTVVGAADEDGLVAVAVGDRAGLGAGAEQTAEGLPAGPSGARGGLDLAVDRAVAAADEQSQGAAARRGHGRGRGRGVAAQVVPGAADERVIP